MSNERWHRRILVEYHPLNHRKMVGLKELGGYEEQEFTGDGLGKREITGG